jgi:hypothetical protein
MQPWEHGTSEPPPQDISITTQELNFCFYTQIADTCIQTRALGLPSAVAAAQRLRLWQDEWQEILESVKLPFANYPSLAVWPPVSGP